MSKMTIKELARPLTSIEKAELSSSFGHALNEEGRKLLRRLLFQSDRGDQALAALAALRDPSDAVVETAARAAYKACREWGGAQVPWDEISPVSSAECQEHWRIMQRAAINAAVATALADA